MGLKLCWLGKQPFKTYLHVLWPNTMSEDLRFLLKLLGVSTGLAIAIKYGGPLLPLSGSSPIALAIVLAPVIGIGLWMVWKIQSPA